MKRLLGCGRWRAGKEAKLKTLPCLIRPEPFSDADILEMQLIVGLQSDKIREEELAPKVFELMKLKGWSERTAAVHLGVARASIQSWKQLAETTDEEKEAITEYRESETEEEIEEEKNCHFLNIRFGRFFLPSFLVFGRKGEQFFNLFFQCVYFLF